MRNHYSENNTPESFAWSRWLPVMVGIGVFALTMLLWQNLKLKERIHLESGIESRAQAAQSEVLTQLLPQIQGLVRMASRFGDHGDMTKTEWEKDASLYVEHFSSYRAISWADSTGHLQWIVPLRGNGELQNLDLFSNRPKTAWEMTKRKDEVGVSPAIDLVQGDKVSFVYIPIFDGAGEFKGYIVGVFPIIKLWDNILKDNEFHDISVSLYEDKQEIYRQANYKDAVENLTSEVFVNFYGISWRMQVRPLRQWVEMQDTSTSYAALCFGTVMALLLSLAFHFASAARLQAAMAGSANNELVSQVEARKQAEVALWEIKELYRDIVNLVPDIVYRLDTQGRFIYVSPAGAYFGFDPEKMIGKPFAGIVHPDDVGLARYHFDEKRRGERATRLVEFRIMSPGGIARDCEMKETTIHLSATGYYVEKAKPAFAGTQGIIRDITEQKKARDALCKANEELELRVRERTQSLLDLNRNLQDEIRERQAISMVLQGNEARLRAIMDNAPVMMYLKDLQGHYCRVNRKFESFLKVTEEEILGKNDNELFPMETAAKLVSHDDMVVRAKASQEFEEVFALPTGLRTCFTIKYPLYDVLGNIYAVGGISMDITERKRAEEALRKSHLELANAQRIAHLGNWVWNVVNNDLHWSDEVYRIFGLAPQSLGASYEAFLESVHPLDRDYVKNSVNESLYHKKPYSIDHRIILNDGSIRTVHEQAEVAIDDEGNAILMRGTVQDITENHQIKSELVKSREQLRDLCAHLELVREEERTRIAREVHDELGQMLTALKIDLSWIKSQLPSCEEPVVSKIESMLALLDSTILAVQRITAELRPQILDILGLIATIEWEVNEFQKRTGIQCWLNVENNINVGKQRSTAFFRIIQEALTNVARHASASNVHVILKDREDHLLLEVRDDGKGMEQERIDDPKAFGLIGIRERALLHKGEVVFRGSPGMGTSISIKFPKNE